MKALQVQLYIQQRFHDEIWAYTYLLLGCDFICKSKLLHLRESYQYKQKCFRFFSFILQTFLEKTYVDAECTLITCFFKVLFLMNQMDKFNE